MNARRRRIVASFPIAIALAITALAFVDGSRIVAPPRTALLNFDREVVFMETPLEDDFARAGIVAGDAIAGLDGVPFASPLDFNRRMRDKRPGDVVTLDVRRDGRPIALTTTMSPNLGVREYVGLGIPVVVLILLGTVVFYTRPQLPGGFLLLFGCLSPALLAAQKATGYTVGGASALVVLAALLFGVLNGALMAHFFLTFPERGPVQRRLLPALWIAYAIAAVVTLRLLLPEFVPQLRAAMPGAIGTRRLILVYEYSVGLCLVIAAVSAGATARRAATPRGRRQAAVLCAGALAGLVTFFGLWVLPRAAGYPPVLGAVALCLLMLIMPVATVVAIVFHRLFEINVLTRQRLVYGAFSLLIALLFVAAAAGAGRLAEPYVHLVGLPWLAAIAALLAIALHPLRGWANGVVDRVLYRKRYDYRPALTEIAGRLAGMIDPAEAVLYVRMQLDALLGPEWIAIVARRGMTDDLERFDGAGARTPYVSGPAGRRLLALLEDARAPFAPGQDEWGDLMRPALVAGMRSGEAVIGALLVGPRRVDVPYRLEDEDFLQTLASITGSVLDRGRMAEERSQRERLALVGSATAAVVHELKNPLAGIKSAVAVLRRRLGQEPRSNELAEIVEHEIDRLQDTILGVLTYVRPHSSPAVAVSLGDTLGPLVTVVDADFRAAGVEVELKTTGAESLVAGDPGHLRQMLLNLLLNAREAMPGGGRIDVSVEPWKSASGEPSGEPSGGPGGGPSGGPGGGPGGDALGVEVVVRDNGPGFSAEALSRASEPFYSTKRLGTGLGLANVKRLVEDHGGELVLGNRPEGGAEVRLRLRAAEVGVGRSVKNGRTD